MWQGGLAATTVFTKSLVKHVHFPGNAAFQQDHKPDSQRAKNPKENSQSRLKAAGETLSDNKSRRVIRGGSKRRHFILLQKAVNSFDKKPPENVPCVKANYYLPFVFSSLLGQ